MDEYLKTRTMVLLRIMQYSLDFLREIQKKARTNYEDFKIGKATRVWIIVLGIRKTPMDTSTDDLG